MYNIHRLTGADIVHCFLNTVNSHHHLTLLAQYAPLILPLAIFSA